MHETMTELLPGGKFPPPTPEGIVEYLKWDDWRVLGALSRQEGGEHGQRLLNRDFFREIWTTPEFPSEQDSLLLNSVEESLGSLVVARCAAGKSWYKLGDPDLPIAPQDGTKPLSQCSTIVGSMQPTNLTRLYVSPEHRVKAEEIVKTIRAKEN